MRLFNLNGLASMAALGLVACATSTAASRAPMAEADTVDDQAALELREHHRHHHRGGTMQFIAMSLDTLGPDDAKRPQVEAIQGELYACMAPVGGNEKVLLMTIADGVAAGATEPVKVDAVIAQLEVAAVTVRDCSTTALDQLHALLSPAEREELVDKVLAHWEVWQQANQDDVVSARRRGGRLAELARDVNLSPQQVERISLALHEARGDRTAKFDRAAVDNQVQAFAKAFLQDSFDAKSIDVDVNARLAGHGARRMADFYEIATPLLTVEQRTALAGHLREHAAQQPTISAK